MEAAILSDEPGIPQDVTPLAPPALRWVEALGGIGGLIGLGLVALLPVGAAPIRVTLAEAAGLAALPVAGGLVMSAFTLIVMSQAQERPDLAGWKDQQSLYVSGAVLDALAGAGRMGLAILPVILLFATTAEALLYRGILAAGIAGVGGLAVAGVAARLHPLLGRRGALMLTLWAGMGLALILTLLGKSLLLQGVS